MEEILKSFMNENEISFNDFLEEHNYKHLYKRNDYAKLTKQRNEIYEEFPNIRNFIEDKIPMNFSEKETDAFETIISINSQMHNLMIKEAYKLGARDSFIFMEDMDMLKDLKGEK